MNDRATKPFSPNADVIDILIGSAKESDESEGALTSTQKADPSTAANETKGRAALARPAVGLRWIDDCHAFAILNDPLIASVCFIGCCAERVHDLMTGSMMSLDSCCRPLAKTSWQESILRAKEAGMVAIMFAGDRATIVCSHMRTLMPDLRRVCCPLLMYA